MERLEEGVESLKRSIEMVKEGKEPDEIGELRGTTPKKSRRDDPDQPPDPEIAKMVRGKESRAEKRNWENLPELDMEDKSGVCLFVKKIT